MRTDVTAVEAYEPTVSVHHGSPCNLAAKAEEHEEKAACVYHVLNAHAVLEAAGFYDGSPFNQAHGDARIDHIGRLLVMCSPKDREIALEAVDKIVHDVWEAEGGRIAAEDALQLASLKAVP